MCGYNDTIVFVAVNFGEADFHRFWIKEVVIIHASPITQMGNMLAVSLYFVGKGFCYGCGYLIHNCKYTSILQQIKHLTQKVHKWLIF